MYVSPGYHVTVIESSRGVWSPSARSLDSQLRDAGVAGSDLAKPTFICSDVVLVTYVVPVLRFLKTHAFLFKIYE